MFFTLHVYDFSLLRLNYKWALVHHALAVYSEQPPDVWQYPANGYHNEQQGLVLQKGYR